jgi:AraC family transcriptional regulator
MRFHRPKGLLAGFSWAAGPGEELPLIEAGEQWAPRDRPIPEHRNQGWEIFYQPAGRSRWRCAGRNFEVGAGGYYLIAPRVGHRLLGFSDREAHYYYAVVPERCLPGGRVPRWPRPYACGAGAFPLETAFRGLMRELTLEDAGQAEALACYATALRIEMGRLLAPPRNRPAPPGFHPAVLRACELLEGHPADRWRLDELAALCGVSVPHLIALFRRDLGQTPRRYLLRRRIERAEEWLRTTDRPVTDIAVDLGFSSSQHFARAFRRLTGAAPSSLRRAAGGRDPAGVRRRPAFGRAVP